MDVVSFAEYARPSVRNRDCAPAFLLVTALKHLNKRIGQAPGLDTRRGDQALEWFGSLAAWVVRTKRLMPPIVLVPMPNSNCLIDAPVPSRTVTLARAIEAQIPGAAVVDCLRWRRLTLASHRGGSRDFGSLLSNLIVSCSFPVQGTLVLVDDIVTTGAHLRAAALALRKSGLECEDAVCVARAVRGTLIRPAFGIASQGC
jgi:hypothetical protein